MKRNVIFAWTIAHLCSAIGFSADNSRFNELMDIEFNELSRFFDGSLTAANILSVPTNPTPDQPQGPFYPIRLPSEVDTDLTIVNGGPRAQGTVVYVQGQIMDLEKNVITGAKVEIWQACATGKYKHPRDPNPAPIDPNFQYYASTNSDTNGQYIFKTIVPGAYPANQTWWRPEHIHMMVSAPGFQPLTTQLYFNPASFPGTDIGKYNSSDLILKQLTEADQQQLIVSFQASAELNGDKLGGFNVYLKNAQ